MSIGRMPTPTIVLGLICTAGSLGIDALAAPPAPVGTRTAQRITPGTPVALGGAKAKSSTVMSHALTRLSAAYDAHVQSRGRMGFTAADPLVRVVEDRVIVDAVAAGPAGRLKADLEARGARNVVAFGAVVSAQVPLNRLRDLPQLASLHWVRPATMMKRAGTTTSQGDRAMRADVARTNMGVDGSGVSVGTMSDSFD